MPFMFVLVNQDSDLNVVNHSYKLHSFTLELQIYEPLTTDLVIWYPAYNGTHILKNIFHQQVSIIIPIFLKDEKTEA